MRYVIKGNPRPLLRARHGLKRTWDCQKEEKLIFGLELSRQHNNEPLYEGPLHLDCVFYFPYPQKRRKKITYYHAQKPDLSNLIKLIEDVGSGIIYKDDALIASISAIKVFDEEPRTEFTITQLKDNNG